jgi:hypothetical protein
VTGSRVRRFFAVGLVLAFVAAAVVVVTRGVSRHPPASPFRVISDRVLGDVAPAGVVSGLTAATCPGDSLCVAADRGGDILTNTSGRQAVGQWRRWAVDVGRTVTAVSCSSARLCVAGDSAGCRRP